MKRPGLWLLVRRDLARRPIRNAILAMCVASVVAMQTAAFIMDRAGEKGLEQGIARLGADLVAVPRGLDGDMIDSFMTGDAAVFYMDAALESRIAALSFVHKTSPQVFLVSLAGASCCSAWSVFLVGFDPATDFTVTPWLTRNLARPLEKDEILAGAALGMEPGDAAKFYGHGYTVAGALDKTGAGMDSAVFIPMESARLMIRESSQKAEKTLEIGDDRVSAVMIKLTPEAEGGLPAYRAAYEIESAIPEISVIQPDDLTDRVHHNLAGALDGLRLAGFAVWPTAALLIGLIFVMAAEERKTEIGLLRAMGATRSFVFLLIISEAALVSIMGALMGLAVSLTAVNAFSTMIAIRLEIPFSPPGFVSQFELALLALGLAALTGAAAALFAAARAAGMEPYEAIRRPE